MTELSDNYYLRKCYLEQDQVPTQSMMKTKMTPPLATVYFNSMSPKLKVLAGLEPLLKGGGSDWYVPPEDLLQGRSVLKPIKRQVLSKLNHHGIDVIGTSIFEKHRKSMEWEKNQVLADADIKWRQSLTSPNNDLLAAELAAMHKKRNTDHLRHEFKHFTNLYRQSLSKIERIFHESAIAEIKKTQENAIISMQNKYSISLNHQATLLYDAYEIKIIEGKARLKAEFIEDLEKAQKAIPDKIHDLNVDKHIAIRKLQHCFARQNLACQVYVALKEREECLSNMKEIKHKHQQQAKVLTENLAMKDLELFLELQKERKWKKFLELWHIKLCHVVKKFQTFVSYCLNMLPDHAEFFINMEKLMLLQVSEAMDKPTAESMFTREEEQFVTPVPQAIPFYMFCDKGYRAEVDQELCPKHGGTYSDSQMPAIIINRRFLYANCDNFDLFTNKVKDYIHGNRGDNADVNDDVIYENLVPVTYTLSQQLKEIKLESSLIKILKEEITQFDSSIDDFIEICGFCRKPMCSCTDLSPKTATSTHKPASPIESKSSEIRVVTHKLPPNVKTIQLEHEREPKWESFFTHVEPKKCSCSKTAKKHLEHHLPVYMRQMKYGPPELPHYEMCSAATLKAIVKEAKKEISPIPKEIQTKQTKEDMSTQYSDPEFDMVCTCLSESEVECLFGNNNIDPKMLESSWAGKSRVVGGDISPSFITRRASSFADDRVRSLRNLLREIPELQVIFERK